MSKEEQRQFFPLTPEKAMGMWPRVFDFINDALPASSDNLDERKTRIQESLVTGNLTVWLGLKQREFVILVSTTVNVDPISGETELLIYSMALAETLNPDDLRFGMSKLKEHAKAIGVSKVTALTRVDFIKKLFENEGGKTTYTMELEV